MACIKLNEEWGGGGHKAHICMCMWKTTLNEIIVNNLENFRRYKFCAFIIWKVQTIKVHLPSTTHPMMGNSNIFVWSQ